MSIFIKRNKIELLISLALLVIGIVAIIIPGATTLLIVTWIIGALLITTGLIIFIGIVQNKVTAADNVTFHYIAAILMIVAGFLLIVINRYWLRLIVGIIFIIHPTMKIIFHYNRRSIIYKEIYKYFIGLIYIFSFPSVLEIVFIIMGSSLVILSIIIIVLAIIYFRKDQSRSMIHQFILKKIEKGIE